MQPILRSTAGRLITMRCNQYGIVICGHNYLYPHHDERYLGEVPITPENIYQFTGDFGRKHEALVAVQHHGREIADLTSEWQLNPATNTFACEVIAYKPLPNEKVEYVITNEINVKSEENIVMPLLHWLLQQPIEDHSIHALQKYMQEVGWI